MIQPNFFHRIEEVGEEAGECVYKVVVRATMLTSTAAFLHPWIPNLSPDFHPWVDL